MRRWQQQADAEGWLLHYSDIRIQAQPLVVPVGQQGDNMGSISDYIGQHTQSYSEDANQRHSPSGGGRNRQQAGRLPRAEDGQHYATSFYTPGESSGFKSSIKESARVGHLLVVNRL